MRVLSQTQTSIEKKVLNQISDLTTIESLEQHPIFLKIVKECRKSFGASFSMLSVSERCQKTKKMNSKKRLIDFWLLVVI